MSFRDEPITQAAWYTRHLKRRADHAPGRQEFLQRRVFQTYKRLMWKFVGSPLLGDLLDIGGVEGGFIKVYSAMTGCNAFPVSIEQGIDLEKDRFDGVSGLPADFDIACANSVIEHLHDPTNMLSETYRVLRPGGYFILVTPCWPYCWRDFYDSYTHIRPYSLESLRAALGCHGFSVLAMVPWMVNKSDWWWNAKPSVSFWMASALPFPGLDSRPWIPECFKGMSRSLLALAMKPR